MDIVDSEILKNILDNQECSDFNGISKIMISKPIPLTDIKNHLSLLNGSETTQAVNGNTNMESSLSFCSVQHYDFDSVVENISVSSDHSDGQNDETSSPLVQPIIQCASSQPSILHSSFDNSLPQSFKNQDCWDSIGSNSETDNRGSPCFTILAPAVATSLPPTRKASSVANCSIEGVTVNDNTFPVVSTSEALLLDEDGFLKEWLNFQYKNKSSILPSNSSSADSPFCLRKPSATISCCSDQTSAFESVDDFDSKFQGILVDKLLAYDSLNNNSLSNPDYEVVHFLDKESEQILNNSTKIDTASYSSENISSGPSISIKIIDHSESNFSAMKNESMKCQEQSLHSASSMSKVGKLLTPPPFFKSVSTPTPSVSTKYQAAQLDPNDIKHFRSISSGSNFSQTSQKCTSFHTFENASSNSSQNFRHRSRTQHEETNEVDPALILLVRLGASLTCDLEGLFILKIATATVDRHLAGISLQISSQYSSNHIMSGQMQHSRNFSYSTNSQQPSLDFPSSSSQIPTPTMFTHKSSASAGLGFSHHDPTILWNRSQVNGIKTPVSSSSLFNYISSAIKSTICSMENSDWILAPSGGISDCFHAFENSSTCCSRIEHPRLVLEALHHILTEKGNEIDSILMKIKNLQQNLYNSHHQQQQHQRNTKVVGTAVSSALTASTSNWAPSRLSFFGLIESMITGNGSIIQPPSENSNADVYQENTNQNPYFGFENSSIPPIMHSEIIFLIHLLSSLFDWVSSSKKTIATLLSKQSSDVPFTPFTHSNFSIPPSSTSFNASSAVCSVCNAFQALLPMDCEAPSIGLEVKDEIECLLRGSMTHNFDEFSNKNAAPIRSEIQKSEDIKYCKNNEVVWDYESYSNDLEVQEEKVIPLFPCEMNLLNVLNTKLNNWKERETINQSKSFKGISFGEAHIRKVQRQHLVRTTFKLIKHQLQNQSQITFLDSVLTSSSICMSDQFQGSNIKNDSFSYFSGNKSVVFTAREDKSNSGSNNYFGSSSQPDFSISKRTKSSNFSFEAENVPKQKNNVETSAVNAMIDLSTVYDSCSMEHVDEIKGKHGNEETSTTLMETSNRSAFSNKSTFSNVNDTNLFNLLIPLNHLELSSGCIYQINNPLKTVETDNNNLRAFKFLENLSFNDSSFPFQPQHFPISSLTNNDGSNVMNTNIKHNHNYNNINFNLNLIHSSGSTTVTAFNPFAQAKPMSTINPSPSVSHPLQSTVNSLSPSQSDGFHSIFQSSSYQLAPLVKQILQSIVFTDFSNNCNSNTETIPDISSKLNVAVKMDNINSLETQGGAGTEMTDFGFYSSLVSQSTMQNSIITNSTEKTIVADSPLQFNLPPPVIITQSSSENSNFHSQSISNNNLNRKNEEITKNASSLDEEDDIPTSIISGIFKLVILFATSIPAMQYRSNTLEELNSYFKGFYSNSMLVDIDLSTSFIYASTFEKIRNSASNASEEPDHTPPSAQIQQSQNLHHHMPFTNVTLKFQHSQQQSSFSSLSPTFSHINQHPPPTIIKDNSLIVGQHSSPNFLTKTPQMVFTYGKKDNNKINASTTNNHLHSPHDIVFRSALSEIADLNIHQFSRLQNLSKIKKTDATTEWSTQRDNYLPRDSGCVTLSPKFIQFTDDINNNLTKDKKINSISLSSVFPENQSTSLSPSLRMSSKAPPTYGDNIEKYTLSMVPGDRQSESLLPQILTDDDEDTEDDLLINDVKHELKHHVDSSCLPKERTYLWFLEDEEGDLGDGTDGAVEFSNVSSGDLKNENSFSAISQKQDQKKNMNDCIHHATENLSIENTPLIVKNSVTRSVTAQPCLEEKPFEPKYRIPFICDLMTRYLKETIFPAPTEMPLNLQDEIPSYMILFCLSKDYLNKVPNGRSILSKAEFEWRNMGELYPSIHGNDAKSITFEYEENHHSDMFTVVNNYDDSDGKEKICMKDNYESEQYFTSSEGKINFTNKSPRLAHLGENNNKLISSATTPINY